MSIDKFEIFLALMEENWPQAYSSMMPAIPRIDKIQSINAIRRGKIMAQYGLKASDFGLLSALRRSPSPYLLTPTEIMDNMLISSGGLTKALYRLEDKAMVARSASPTDGRIKRVQLTEKGKKVIEQIVVKVQQTHQFVRTVFSKEEAEQLDALLAKLQDAIEAPIALD